MSAVMTAQAFAVLMMRQRHIAARTVDDVAAVTAEDIGRCAAPVEQQNHLPPVAQRLPELTADEGFRRLHPDVVPVAAEVMETAEGILLAIPTRERLITERLLAYEPDTAGGLMTTDFLSVPDYITVDEALLRVRALPV